MSKQFNPINFASGFDPKVNDPRVYPEMYMQNPASVSPNGSVKQEPKVKDKEKEKFMDKISKMYDIVKEIESSYNDECNHVSETGMVTLGEPDENGYRTCTMCGKKFKLLDIDSKDDLETILETAKIYSDPRIKERILELMNGSKK